MKLRLRAPLAALALTACAFCAAAQDAARVDAGKDRVLPLEVLVNGAKTGTWLLVEHGGVLYAPRDAFEEWRLQLPASARTIDFKGQAYWPLTAIPGFKAKVDFATQSVELLFSPQAFATSRLTREMTKAPPASPVLPSLFFNYDVNYSVSSGRDTAMITDLGFLSELGASSAWGVLTTSTLARNLVADHGLAIPRGLVRLESTFTRDFPESNRTLRVGDTTTRAAMWGRDVYFGGIRYGTNFALSPGVVSQPLPAVTGLSAAPSTVELYVNDVLRQVSTVPTGPFAIDNMPLLTGNGEARLVVRDLLGRETVIVQSFFTSSQLLAAGLNDWSAEAGSVRRDLGVESNRYGDAFGAGTWRHGYSNSLTLEGRVEATRELSLVGLGLVSALPAQILGKVALAGSRDRAQGSGGLWLAGIDRQSVNGGVSLQAQGASSRFRQLGQEAGDAPIKLQVAGNFSHFTERTGALGLGFAHLRRFAGDDITTASANYSMRVGARAIVTLTASRAFRGSSGSAIGMNFIMPLDNNRTVNVTANSRGGTQDLYATASQNAGPDSSLSWRALAGVLQDHSRAEAGLYYLGRYGGASADVSASRDLAAVRLGGTGGMVVANGNLFVTRRVEDSFAVAEVAGYGDVGIGLGSNVLSRTDASGVALIPRLLPYQPNSVRIDPRELPVSAEIDTIEMVVVPAWRSAVAVRFPVRSGRGALIKIVLDDGEAAPAGATVAIEGDSQEFYVARRGEAFVTGLQPANRLSMKWNGRQCTFDVALPPETAAEIARIGPQICKTVAR